MSGSGRGTPTMSPTRWNSRAFELGVVPLRRQRPASPRPAGPGGSTPTPCPRRSHRPGQWPGGAGAARTSAAGFHGLVSSVASRSSRSGPSCGGHPTGRRGYRRAIRLGTGDHDPRNRVITMAGTGDHDRAESVITMGRNRAITMRGIRNSLRARSFSPAGGSPSMTAGPAGDGDGIGDRCTLSSASCPAGRRVAPDVRPSWCPSPKPRPATRGFEFGSAASLQGNGTFRKPERIAPCRLRPLRDTLTRRGGCGVTASSSRGGLVTECRLSDGKLGVLARLGGLEPPASGLEVRARHLRPTVPKRDELRRNQQLAAAPPAPSRDRLCPNSMPNRHQNRHHLHAAAA